MSGIYIHIPFCKQKCIYCNFHSGGSLRLKDDFVIALLKEIELSKNYLSEPIETIYFGGGTPSLLDFEDFERIFKKLNENYNTSDCIEITIEANPEDLTEEKIKSLSNLPFNRVSIGTQAFDADSLNYLKRKHSVEQNNLALDLIQKHWTENISADLIYGIPTLENEKLISSLYHLKSKGIPHISCYALTVEPSTSLHKFINSNKIQAPIENFTLEQMDIVISELENLGYIQYEISNFCLPNYQAIHNSNYWEQKQYLGLGPSAHSFNGKSRQWNIANNIKYINSLKENKQTFEIEELTQNDIYNEYIMTGLRTMKGIDSEYISSVFGKKHLTIFEENSKKFIQQAEIIKIRNKFVLSKKGIKISDYIISELFITN
ncbi:MAG: radical SAM family heme chaperone HemW [Bacteroidota bacterium]